MKIKTISISHHAALRMAQRLHISNHKAQQAHVIEVLRKGYPTEVENHRKQKGTHFIKYKEVVYVLQDLVTNWVLKSVIIGETAPSIANKIWQWSKEDERKGKRRRPQHRKVFGYRKRRFRN